MQNKSEVLSYLETLSLIIITAIYFLFPLVFTSLTSDAFVLPKQIILAVGVLLSLVLFGIRTIIDGKLRLRTTPFDLPVFLFALVLLLSAVLSGNMADSIIAYIPLLYAVLLYFVTVNIIKDKKGILFITLGLLASTGLIGLLAVLSYFKIYLLAGVFGLLGMNLEYTKVQFFSPMGGLLDQALLFGIVLPLAGYLAHPVFSSILLHGKTDTAELKKPTPFNIAFGVGFIFVALGLLVTLFQLMTTQQPLILPLWEGFRIGLGAISRDTERALQSFLFGSGYGTFLTDFTRFKEASYNADPKLWSFTFFRSSTFFFELLATTGFLGIISYLFILFKIVKEKWFFLPIFLLALASFILPFSFLIQVLFFMVLAIFALVRAQQNPRKYHMTELYIVALDRGLLSLRPEGHTEPTTKNSPILPVLSCIIVFALAAVLGYFSARFIMSDLTFQRSLVAAAQNNGGATYQLQRQAIETFPYRDAYYRVFSQTNLALANNLAASQPQNSSPSAETQQTILTLIQQSINSGRSAVTLSPRTTLNWNNLSGVYRSLIGFGQNADQFAILTNQQAIALDEKNPQQYINLGGIYYQLGQWEEAQRNFQIAITLKPDYANAYYNLGHALESKGDLANALTVYQTVRSLVGDDKESVKKIDEEIRALQQKIGQQANAGNQTQPETQQSENEETSIGVNQPTQQLPERNPQVKIPGVTVTPLPSSSPTPSAEPTQAAEPTPNL